MKFKKYLLLALITLSLTISESWGVNFESTLLNSTAVAQTVNNRKAEADKLSKQAFIRFRVGQFQSALQYWEQSLTLYQDAYNNSISKYRQQNSHISKKNGNRLAISSSPLINLSLPYKLVHRKADNIEDNGHLYFQSKSREISKQLNQQFVYLKIIAECLGNLGLTNYKLGYYDKAISYYQQSLVTSRNIKSPLGIAQSLAGLGNVYHSQGDYQKAIDYHEKSLVEIVNIINENHPFVAQSLGNQGNVYHSHGNYYKAIYYYQKSLKIYKKIENPKAIAASLNNLGATYERLKKYKSAKENLYQAITIWEHVRKQLRNQDTWKITIFEEQARTYRLLQEVLVAQKQPLQALEISERGRTRALVEILFRRLSQKPEEELIPPSPNLREIQQIAQQQNATLVQYSLTPDEIYIWVIPPQGKIEFRNVPLPKDVSLTELVKISRNSIGVRGRNSNNSSKKQDNCTDCLKKLHQLLIQPIAEFLPKDEQQRVIFIPHRELFLVAFVALQDEDNKYLIEKHTILTAPSIQALDLSQQNKQVQINSSARIFPGNHSLIVGNPTMPKGGVGKDLQPLKQLPGAEEEAKNIAEMVNTKPIIGNQATESVIVEKMASAKLIHLATHGLLDDINGIGSAGAIALAPDPPSSLTKEERESNGFLTTSEIMERFGLPGKQKLKADLVVLSACDTGRGDIRAEGIIGLSRAFMASGVPSLVVSLWKVPDDATTNLMTEFYTNIYERKFDKATAMREAMLTMINDDDPDPKNWAAFTVIGKAE